MAPQDRQERRLNRQRGAGIRQVQGGNFAFTFASDTANPAASYPNRSAGATPRNNNNRPSSRAASESSSARPSTQRTPGSVIRVGAILRSATRSKTTPDSNAQTDPKRNESATNAGHDAVYVVNGGDGGYSQRQSSPLFVTPTSESKRKRTPIHASRTLLPDSVSEDELERNDAQHRSRATTSITSSVRRQTRMKTITSQVEEEQPDILSSANKSQAGGVQSSADSPGTTKLSRLRATDPDQNLQTPSGTIKSTRRPRRSVVEFAATSDQGLVDQQIFDELAAENGGIDELSPAGSRNQSFMVTSTPREVYQSKIAPTTANGNPEPSKAQLGGSEYEDGSFRLDQGSLQLFKNSQHTGNTTTALEGQQPRKRTKRTSSDHNVKIPITVYRPVHPVDCFLDDPLGQDPYPSSNAVDALSQSVSETITAYVDRYTLTTRTQPGRAAKKSSFKRGRKALIAFQKVLQDQLFDLSSITNTTFVYESRFRRLKKDVARAREDLIGLRSERHDIELRKDELRIEHTQAMDQIHQQRELHDEVRDIAEAIRRGREKAQRENKLQDGLNDDPITDYHAVLNHIHNGGIAERVKQCNMQLQRKIADARI